MLALVSISDQRIQSAGHGHSPVQLDKLRV